MVEFRRINQRYIACSDGSIWKIIGGGDIECIPQTIDRNGNCRVKIYSHRRFKICYVHSLIMTAFYGLSDKKNKTFRW